MIKTIPFLLFDGQCAEAMLFYQNCFGGELSLVKVEDTPMRSNFEEKDHKKVMYALLKNETIEISATDWLHKTRLPKQGNTVAIYIEGDTKDDLEKIFEKLSVGASKDLIDPLISLPFGTYGHLADTFEVHWFFRSSK
jgi:PhnB protein